MLFQPIKLHIFYILTITTEIAYQKMGTVEESSAYLPEVFIMGRFNEILIAWRKHSQVHINAASIQTSSFVFLRKLSCLCGSLSSIFRT